MQNSVFCIKCCHQAKVLDYGVPLALLPAVHDEKCLCETNQRYVALIHLARLKLGCESKC